jgi:8-oxo-dGTP pyrophosphatase MutT (NUDIX family)
MNLTDLRVGVVDVIPVDAGGGPDDWRVLLLRRAAATRCSGSWEVVHGRIEEGERPEDAGIRELKEETGLGPGRLYNVTCQPFYLHSTGVVQLAVVFAALVDPDQAVRLGPEHDAHAWLPREEASRRMSWPRSRQALDIAFGQLRTGNAGCLEDVLRVR